MKQAGEKFTFTSELMEAVKLISAKDSFEIEPEMHQPVIEEEEIEGNIRHVEHKIARLFQTKDFLIFALANYKDKIGSTLHLYYFGKGKGENQNKEIPTIKGQVTSMEFVPPKITDKDQVHSGAEGLLLLLGNADGYLKILDFGVKPQLKSIQIDTKPIVDIKVPPSQKFYNTKVCFTLSQDYTVFILNIELEAVIAHFRPTIMMCDQAMKISLHNSMKYFIESTKGGYIVLWKINEKIFDNIKKEKKQRRKNQQLEEDEEVLSRRKATSKPPQKIYNIFPTAIYHSPCIQGLKYIEMMGDLIALITEEGVFKIIALNIQEKQEFATILEYKIENGSTILDAKILEKEECLIVTKRYPNSEGTMIELIFFTPELLVVKVLRVRLLGLSQIESFLFSQNKKFLFARNRNKFYINYTLLFADKLSEHGKQTKLFRELSY